MNLGSVAEQIYNRTDNIPTTISGAGLLNIIDNQRLFMEEYTGDSIGSTSIAERFQPALIDLSMGDMFASMDTFGVDAAGYKIGDFSKNKGNDSSSVVAANKFSILGKRKLEELGHKTRFGQAL